MIIFILKNEALRNESVNIFINGLKLKKIYRINIYFFVKYPQANYEVAMGGTRNYLNHHDLAQLAKRFDELDPNQTNTISAGVIYAALDTMLCESYR